MILVLVLFLAQFGVNADGSYESETDSAFDSGHEITPEGDETPSSIGEGGESSGVSEASPESEAPITGEALTESFSSHSSSTTTVLVSETLAITESLTEAAPEGASLILDESSNEVASEGGSFVVSTISIGESTVRTDFQATASLSLTPSSTVGSTPSSTVSLTPSSTVRSTPSCTVSLAPTASSSSTISQSPSLSIRTRTPSASSTPISSPSYRPVNVSGGTANLTSVGENETILIGGTGIVKVPDAENLTLAGMVLQPDANLTFAFNLTLTTQLELSGGQIISAAGDHELTFKDSAEIKFDSPGGVLGQIGLGFVAQGNEKGSIPGKIEVSISRSSLTTTSLADFSHVLVYGLNWDIGCKLWLGNVFLSDAKQFDKRCVNNRDSWYGRLLAGSQTNLEIFGIVEKSKTGMIIGIVVAVVVVLAVVIAVVVTRRRRVKFSASTETFTRTESTETFSPSEYSTNEELERIDEA